MIENFVKLKFSCVISLGNIFFNEFIHKNAMNSLIFLTIWKYRIDVSFCLDFYGLYSHIIQKHLFFKNVHSRTTISSAY